MSSKRPLKVAAAQITPVFMKKRETVEKCAETMLEAGRQGVELDLNDRIVAKNVFDCMGHYSRWDVVSLQIRDKDFEPATPLSPRRIKLEQIEEVAERHHLPAEKVETILRELQSMEIEVDG